MKQLALIVLLMTSIVLESHGRPRSKREIEGPEEVVISESWRSGLGNGIRIGKWRRWHVRIVPHQSEDDSAPRYFPAPAVEMTSPPEQVVAPATDNTREEKELPQPYQSEQESALVETPTTMAVTETLTIMAVTEEPTTTEEAEDEKE